MKNFYNPEIELNNVEIAIAADAFYTTQDSAKFYIPILQPFTSNTTKENKFPFQGMGNIQNKEPLSGIGGTNIFTGCIDIPIHSERLGSFYHDIVPKGTEFMVVFVGGDINKPRILGRY